MLIYWKEYQAKMIEKVKASENPLTIAGDGRHDSMGHSAKYCAYTTLCCTVPQIIHVSLVQVQLMHGIQTKLYNSCKHCKTISQIFLSYPFSKPINI